MSVIVAPQGGLSSPTSPRLRVVAPPAPHGRLGVAWTAVTIAAIAGGRWPLAVWLAVVGFVAVAGSVRNTPVTDRPRLWSAGLGAVALPLAAAAGPIPFAVCAAVVAFAAVVANRPAGRGGVSLLLEARQRASMGELRPMAMAVVLSLGVGLGGASMVVLRGWSVTSVALLLALVSCHDASRYLVGWGAPAEWEGVAAGVAAVGAATLATAVIEPSPVHGALTWLLGALVAVGAATGPWVSDLLVGNRPAPGLRRFDSLAVAAPLWLVASLLSR